MPQENLFILIEDKDISFVDRISLDWDAKDSRVPLAFDLQKSGLKWSLLDHVESGFDASRKIFHSIRGKIG